MTVPSVALFAEDTLEVTGKGAKSRLWRMRVQVCELVSLQEVAGLQQADASQLNRNLLWLPADDHTPLQLSSGNDAKPAHNTYQSG
jgi:hypothetical protein